MSEPNSKTDSQPHSKNNSKTSSKLNSKTDSKANSKATSKADTDVIIVGAGPVGLTCACMLQHFGISFQIFEKKSTPTPTSNALLISMRTLQLLQSLGIADELIKHGFHARSMSLYAAGKMLAQINIDHRLPFQFLLTLPQAKTEAILREHLTKHSVEIRQQHEFTSLTQNKETVCATFTTPQGEITMSSFYLFACDGAHSRVRKQCNIKYQGNDIENHFVMIDAKWKAEKSNQQINAFFMPDLTMGVIPFAKDGQARIMAEVSRDQKFNRIDIPSLQDMQAIAAKCIPFEHQINNMTWSTKFSIHERLAEKYTDGRIFLIGDAAHAHSPAGGMGMNTGIQDAVNLCWKINACHLLGATTDLLNSYAEERRPVAKKVIRASSRMTQVFATKNKLACRIRNLMLNTLFKFKRVQHLFLMMDNQLDIKYKKNICTTASEIRLLAAGTAIASFTLPLKGEVFDFYRDMDPKYFYILCFGKKHNDSEMLNKLQHASLPIMMLDATDISCSKMEIKWPAQGFIIIRPDSTIALSSRDENKVYHYFEALFPSMMKA